MILFRAMTCPASYGKMVQLPWTRMFLYLWILVLMVNLPGLVATWKEVAEAVTVLSEALEEISPLRLEGGQLVMDFRQTLVLEPAPGQIVVIDPLGEVSEKILEKYHRGMLILPQRAIFRDSAMYHTVRFSSLRSPIWEEALKANLAAWYAGAAAVHQAWLLMASGLRHVAGSLFLASLGLLLRSMGLPAAGWWETWKAAIFGLTGPACLTMALGFARVSTDAWWPLYWALGMVYLIMALSTWVTDPEGR